MRLNIGHLYPELLNLYGDRGNISCMKKRLEWRGIEVQVKEYLLGEEIDFSDVDILLLGGGSNREQALVCEQLLSIQEQLRAYIEDNGTMLAVCGGYQLLGEFYQMDEGRVEGLGLIDMYTIQKEGRLIGNIAVGSDLFSMPIVGFENHGGRTFLGDLVRPLGSVLHGFGNDGSSGSEGIIYKNLIGTYIHGPLLPKNPQVCDFLLEGALKRKYGNDKSLTELSDKEEKEANLSIYQVLSQT